MTIKSRPWHLKIATTAIITLLLGGISPIANAVEPEKLQATKSTLPEIVDDYQLILTSSYGEQFFEYPASAPTLEAKLNRPDLGANYRLFIVDVTIDKVLSVNGAKSDWVAAIKPGFSFGDPHYYQAFYASYNTSSYNDVTKFSELKDIKASSNIISLTRTPWDVSISTMGEDQIDVITNNGGGNYVTYLVDEKTKEIIWNDAERGHALFPENPYHIEDVTWATAYVAKTWIEYDGGSGEKPLVKDDLEDIQATSRNYKRPTGAGTLSSKEIAGGTNLSVPCSQGCQGDPINMATGEFFLHETDLSTPGVGLAVAMNRAYSITNKDVVSPLGYGWSTDSTINITSPNGISNLRNDTVLTVYQENGSIVNFSKNADGNYESGSAIQAELTYANGQFTMRRGEKEMFIFNADGKIIKKQDQYGNVIDYAYNGDNLSSETDSNGNKLSYTYTNGLLTKVADNNGQSSLYGYNVSKKLLTNVTDSTGTKTTYTYDAQGRMKTLTNPLGGITTNNYDTSNRVTQQKDPRGSLLKFSYSGEKLNQTVTITQPDGSKSQEVYQNGQLTNRIVDFGTPNPRIWTYYYGETNQIISIIGPDNTVHTMSYDANGNLLSSMDAKGAKTTFTYDGQNNLLTTTDALGNISTNTYDAKGNILTNMDPLGGVTSFAYNADNTVAKVTDPRGNESGAEPADYTTVMSYGTKGVVTETKNALGNIIRNGYDSLGRRTSTIDSKGNTSTMSYNVLNLPSKIIDPLFNETVITYDAMGNTITSKDANGAITTYTYDLMGNLLTSKNSLGYLTSYAYDSLNRVISITDPEGKTSSIKYDTSGRVTETTDTLGNVEKNEWNSIDNLISTTDADGKKTSYVYDRNGNLVKSLSPLDSSISFTYDALNRVITQTDAEGRVSKIEYDALGRVLKTISPDGSFITNEYDAVGNTVKTTNENGKSRHYQYDSLSRKTQYVDEVGSLESYSYDENSNLVNKTRVDGTEIGYSYDERNSLIKVDYPDANSDIVYTYNNLGQKVTEQKGSNVISTYAYDTIGQLKTRGPPTSKVIYEYDSVGNKTKITYPSNRVIDYSYDDSGQLKTLTTAGIDHISYEYDNRGNTLTTSLPNQVLKSYNYDADNQLTNESFTKNGANLFEKSLAYNKSGDLTQLGKAGTAVSTPTISDYTYDPLARISFGKDHATGTVESNYVHDATGNLTVNNGINQSFDDSGRLLSLGGKQLTYDDRGNRIDDTVTTTTWGTDNTVVNSHKDTDKVSYDYDANGLLQERKLNNEVTNNFTWDMSNTIPLLLDDGEYEYVYGNSRVPVAQINVVTGEISYPVTDTNGSVTALMNSNGDLSQQVAYTPYGVRSGSLESNLGYAGEWTDKTTNNSYLRARWYDADTGVFLSVDPLTQNTGQAYSYTHGNPLQQIDPMGLCSFSGLLHIGSDCYSFMDSNGFQEFSNGAAGVGDTILFDLGQPIREAIGIGNVIDICSTTYKNSQTTAATAVLFIPGGGVIKAGSVGAKTLSITTKNGKVIDNVYDMGGNYTDLKVILDRVLQKNDLEIHHMPSTKYITSNNYSKDKWDGIAIVIDKSDHYKTRTFGGNAKKAYAEDMNLSYKEVLYKDIRDIRNIAGTKYDKGIMEALRLARDRGLL